MRVLLIGYGVMGRLVERLALESGHEVVGRVDTDDPPIEPDTTAADVAIEFAGPEGAPVRIREAITAGIPVVSGSTGWDARRPDLEALVESRDGALLHAPNLSLGVALFERIVRRAARLFDAASDYRLEVEETHHTRKVDHPSGTASWLADGIVARVERLERWDAELVGESDGSRGSDPEGGPRDDDVLPIRCHRRGDVPGTHVVRATGPDDIVELTHTALRRDGFARGALRAAEWLRGRRGVYSLDDMLDDLMNASDPEAT